MARHLLRLAGGECIRRGVPATVPALALGDREDLGARIEAIKTVCCVCRRRSDSFLRAWRTSFDKRIICPNPAVFTKRQARETNTTDATGVGSLSLQRSTQSWPAPDCPNRCHSPTIVRDSAQRMSIAAENAQAEWADCTL
jgi:hypothetical protein